MYLKSYYIFYDRIKKIGHAHEIQIRRRLYGWPCGGTIFLNFLTQLQSEFKNMAAILHVQSLVSIYSSHSRVKYILIAAEFSLICCRTRIKDTKCNWKNKFCDIPFKNISLYIIYESLLLSDGRLLFVVVDSIYLWENGMVEEVFLLMDKATCNIS